MPNAATQDRGGSGADSGRVCAYCSCVLSADNSGPVCDPCLRARRDYDPALDPSFGAALSELFLLHPDEIVHPLTDLGIAPAFKWSVVTWIRRLRRHMVIEGHSHRGGYTYRPAKVVTPSRRCRGKRLA